MDETCPHCVNILQQCNERSRGFYSIVGLLQTIEFAVTSWFSKPARKVGIILLDHCSGFTAQSFSSATGKPMRLCSPFVADGRWDTYLDHL